LCLILALFWPCFAPTLPRFRAVSDPFWGCFGLFLALFGAVLGCFGAILACFWPFFGDFDPFLGLFWLIFCWNPRGVPDPLTSFLLFFGLFWAVLRLFWPHSGRFASFLGCFVPDLESFCRQKSAVARN
jgi:hypothetical protein